MPYRRQRSSTVKPPWGLVNWGDPITRGLLHWWLMGEGAGIKLHDIVRNLTATGINTPTWGKGPVGVAGKLVAASTQRWETATEQGPQTGATYVTWYSLTTDGVYLAMAMWSASSPNAAYMQLITSSGVVTGRIHQTRDTVFIGRSTGTIAAAAAGPWCLVGFSWDGGTTDAAIKVYVNGIRRDTTDGGAGTFTAPNTSAIQISLGSQRQFNTVNGLLDNGRAWKRPLSDSEHMRLYQEPLAGLVVPKRRIISEGSSRTAAVDVTLEATTLSATATSAISAAAASTLADVSLAATADNAIEAALAVTLDSVTLTSTAEAGAVPEPEAPAQTRIGRGVIIKRRQKKGFTVIEPERPAKLPEIAARVGVTLDDVTLVSTLVMSEAPAARRRRMAVAALLS